MSSFSSLPNRVISRMMTPTLGRLVFGMMILVFTSGLARAERVVLDWSEQIVGEPPVLLSGPDWKISVQSGLETKIIGPKSDPINPLPDSPLALVVPTSGSSSTFVRFDLHPFLQQEPPKKGWIEFDLALTEKGMIAVYLNSSPSESETLRSDKTQLYTLYFRGDDTTLVVPSAGGGGGERFVISPPLLVGEPHKIRIVWDFEGEKPPITLLLDGEPFLAKDEPAVLGVDPAVQDNNINSFVIFLHSGYVGKITVSE